MPLFNIFYIKEHITGSISGTDVKIIILYDEVDGNYYYYGTRNNENQKKYIFFSGKFHYTKLNHLVQFIDILMDGFISHLTTELHQIHIDTYDYDCLNFNVLKSKLNSSTELSAYDKKKESYTTVYNYLQTLVTHEF
jgi:hypothetical protein